MKGIFFADCYFTKSHIYVCMTYHILYCCPSYILSFFLLLFETFFAASFRIQSDHSTPQYLTKSYQTHVGISEIQTLMAHITKF